MRNTPKESTFKKRVMALLKQLPNTYVVSIQQVSISGTPDILMCVNGTFVAWELKRGDDSHPTKLQEYNLKKIKEANGIGVVVRPSNLEKEYSRLLELIKEKV